MKTLYLDLNMGAAGDMLTAALLELVPDRQEFINMLNDLGLPGIVYEAEGSTKCGISGTHMSVTVNGISEEEHMHSHVSEQSYDHCHEQEKTHTHSHSHSSLQEIKHIVCEHLKVSDKVKSDILAVYNLIAEAESRVHGVPVEEIHFHEVGSLDAIADVTAVCLLMEKLAPEKVLASPVHVGCGQVKCAHGILPVPAPATALILCDVPIYGGTIKGELCTPTGAALLKHFVSEFGPMPVIRTKKIGYGMGKKDFEAANCVRAIFGETEKSSNTVTELFCNMDDMTPEALGYAMEILFEAGALDVFTTPIGMKKSRQGVLLSVMCKESDRDKMVELIFRHTTTIGIRERVSNRFVLDREIRKIETPYGYVREKISYGFGVKKSKLEFDDLSKIAKENGKSIEELRKEIEAEKHC